MADDPNSDPARLGLPAFAAMTRLEAAAEPEDGVETLALRTDIHDGWQQGRGAFGGLAIGLMVRAMEQVRDAVHDDEQPRPLRSIMAQLPAPLLVGPAQLEAAVLRRGRSLSSLGVALTQKGRVVAQATGIAAHGRPETHDIQLAAPPPRRTAPAWPDVPPIPQQRLFVPFSSHMEYRVTSSAPGRATAEAPQRFETTGWIRFRNATDASAPLGLPELIALIDAYWPAHMTAATRIRPSATVDFRCYFPPLPTAPLPAAEPLYFEAFTEHAGGGFVNERRALYAADGSLLARNDQSFALLG
ncbi:TesB-like acyl-CoA thioesterase [Plesiocystis pacifica SIR-1]|uniref:TesB-like acyl-CoA thioesterase n=1 Tax=Plesiocystis pacifica SIR-1 TaxID=391625 RepID=A6G1E8_9BACT|nr:thioesterase family protein [Plesiocystis pacifica]EDM80212.1 TesB-like acyl-CoA thioesterase [Plesiocystis pacifica SIR-1]